MPVKKTVIALEPSETAYIYDGSLPGLFCCIHEAVYSHREPASITPEYESQPSLLSEKYIETDNEKAGRVSRSIETKISPGALRLVQDVFLSCLKERELLTLRFLIAGYAEGAAILTMIGSEAVAPLVKAQKHIYGEAHLLKGFVRFSDYGGKLISEITPKNFILPYIADHFAARFSNEDFLIYDKTHKTALVYKDKKKRFVPLDGIELSEASETEERFRSLWKQFYNTIAIEDRYNPRCRMTHMPKRYWENMTEMKDLL